MVRWHKLSRQTFAETDTSESDSNAVIEVTLVEVFSKYWSVNKKLNFLYVPQSSCLILYLRCFKGTISQATTGESESQVASQLLRSGRNFKIQVIFR